MRTDFGVKCVAMLATMMFCTNGDSGGPVFRISNSRAYAVGTITGSCAMRVDGVRYWGCTWTGIDDARTGYSANEAADTGPLPAAVVEGGA